MDIQKKDVYDIIFENERVGYMSTNLPREKWETVKYSKKQIHKAGKTLARGDVSLADFKSALDILNNWRSSHAYPLHVITSNLRKNHVNAIVVQRLKRLDSIIAKLQRFDTMSLYRMQDLGGCRVIVETVDDVYSSKDKYKNSRIRHILVNENDYIMNPKETGYRSYHLSYRFQSDRKDTYNKNMLIEIQFRTELQHIWATAVETMGIYYSRTQLKAGIGDAEILRFFALVSSVFAIKEKTPIVPGTPNDFKSIKQEIRDIDKKNNIISRLSAIKVAMNHVGGDKKNGHFILLLNFKEKKLKIMMAKNIEHATRIYNKIERERSEKIDAVLVSASSFESLKAAYPNYFSDVTKFVRMVQAIIK